jgi:hypothetical protein
MPHFELKKRIENYKPWMPQVSKRFFYDEIGDPPTSVQDYNTEIKYECSLYLSQRHLEEMIESMTGVSAKELNEKLDKFQYHLDKYVGKEKKIINLNFLINTLKVPSKINGYLLGSIGIAAWPKNDKGKFECGGNVEIIFFDEKSPIQYKQHTFWHEVVINLHIKSPKEPRKAKTFAPRPIQQLKNLIKNATSALTKGKEIKEIYNLRPESDIAKNHYTSCLDADGQLRYEKYFSLKQQKNEAKQDENDTPSDTSRFFRIRSGHRILDKLDDMIDLCRQAQQSFKK